MIKASAKPYQGKSTSEIQKSIHRKVMDMRSKKVYNRHTGITIMFIRDGAKKTAFGGNVYPDKAALVDVLEKILEEMKFSHFGKRKPTDKKDVIGYMNFSENATVDN